MFATPYQRETLSNPVVICEEETLTEQAHAVDCDINNILRKHNAGDLLAHVKHTQLQFGDFTEINEYDEALNTIAKARESFEAMPAKLREHFGNNPGTFVEAVTNPERREEMVKLGLAEAISSPTPIKVNPDLEKAIIDMVAKATESTEPAPE